MSHMDYFGQENRTRSVPAAVPIPTPAQSKFTPCVKMDDFCNVKRNTGNVAESNNIRMPFMASK